MAVERGTVKGVVEGEGWRERKEGSEGRWVSDSSGARNAGRGSGGGGGSGERGRRAGKGRRGFQMAMERGTVEGGGEVVGGGGSRGRGQGKRRRGVSDGSLSGKNC